MAVQRGEIYLVNLNPAQGREQAGLRSVLALSVDAEAPALSGPTGGSVLI